MKTHQTLRVRYGACSSQHWSQTLTLDNEPDTPNVYRKGFGSLTFMFANFMSRTDRLCGLLCCFLSACEGKRGDSMNLQCLSLQPASANSLVAHQGDPIIFPNDLKPCFVRGSMGNIGTDPTNIGASRLHREGQYARVNGFIQIEDGLLKPLLVGQARNGSPPEWQRE